MPIQRKKTSSRAIEGATYPATMEGFGKFLNDANKADAKGYSLVGLVKLEKKIAGVWKRNCAEDTQGDYYGGFFEDNADDTPPSFNS